MATPIDPVFAAMTSFIPSPKLGGEVQFALDFRRALILGPRYKAGVLFGTTGPDTQIQPTLEQEREAIQARQSLMAPDADNKTHSFKTPVGASRVDDYVALIDIDYDGYNEGYRVIKFPFIPKELDYNSDSSYAIIKPMGRNTSRYHFMGSEDRLEFEIDWHSVDQSRMDVISKCRMVEALSKGDGYNKPPHRVILQWGQNSVLFQDHVFVVMSAPYRMTHFNKAQVNQSTGSVERTNMLPIQAYQKVTLARISSVNLTKNDIEYVAKTNLTSETFIGYARKGY
jgi:hypothetical protein